MLREVWKAVKTKARKVRVEKAERRRKKGGKKEMRTKRAEKTKKRKNNEGKESSRGMGNLGQRRRSSKVGGRRKIVGTRKVL